MTDKLVNIEEHRNNLLQQFTERHVISESWFRQRPKLRSNFGVVLERMGEAVEDLPINLRVLPIVGEPDSLYAPSYAYILLMPSFDECDDREQQNRIAHILAEAIVERQHFYVHTITPSQAAIKLVESWFNNKQDEHTREATA